MMTRPVYILAAGVVCPHGAGMGALTAALRDGRCSVTRKEFEGIGPLAVGACDFVESRRGEDRGITMLREAFSQLAGPLAACDFVPPERRAVAVASSKGGLLLYLENPAEAPRRLMDLLPDAPARWLAREASAAGPVQAHVGACATGLLNIFAAAEWIAEDRADIAVAGSTEASLCTLYLQSFLSLGALNRNGCHPFDRRHAGFVAGEGSAVFLLASEAAAERSGLAPIARLTGWATAAEAHHSTAIRPGGESIVRLARKICRNADRTLGEIDAINPHGTATPQGDTAEAAAILGLYPDHGAAPPVFALKGGMGHLMGASASVELAGSLAALDGGFVPATAGYQDAADGCERLKVRRGSTDRKVGRVMKWSLGFGGHLAGCIIERG